MSDKNHYTTWEELLEEYFFARNLRAATEWSYAKVVKGFLKFTGADITHQWLHIMKYSDGGDMYSEKSNNRRRPGTIKLHISGPSITMLWKVVYCLRAKTLLTIALYSGTERKSGL